MKANGSTDIRKKRPAQAEARHYLQNGISPGGIDFSSKAPMETPVLRVGSADFGPLADWQFQGTI